MPVTESPTAPPAQPRAVPRAGSISEGEPAGSDPAAANPAGGRPKAWDDAPLRAKVVMLIMLAAIGGALVGMVEAHYHHQIFPLAAGLLLVVASLTLLGKRWVWQPLERLLSRLRKLESMIVAQRVDNLPFDRGDEIGQIARTIRHLVNLTIRENNDARQLRRTLDHRVATETRKATRNLEQLALRDALTGLGNRRFLDENLPPLIESAQASRTNLICLVMDMDNFKQVNDRLGHARGDELLRFIGNLVRGAIRFNDYAVRIGGDEFVLLLPGCTPAEGAALADRLRHLFRQQVITAWPDAGPVSLSVGIAGLGDLVRPGAEELLATADRRLYHAKRAGKGRSVAAN